MKRLLPILLCAVMLFSFAASVCAAENGYDDVSGGEWYAEAVAALREKGVMDGVGGNRFDPDGIFTRAQLATVLYRLADKPAVQGEDGFTDTESGKWYSDAVLWASQNGIVNGYGSGLFGTTDPTTQEQLAVMLWRSAGSYVLGSEYADADGAENQASAWAVDAVRWARVDGLLTDAVTFVPTAAATRAQVADMVYRYLQLMEMVDKHLERFLFCSWRALTAGTATLRLGYGISNNGSNVVDAASVSTYTHQYAVKTRYIRAVRCNPASGDNYTIRICGYDAEGTFVSSFDTTVFDGGVIPLDPDWAAFGMQFQRVDGAEMEQSDVDAIRTLVFVGEQTDRSLTQSGDPANALSERDALDEADEKMQASHRNDPSAISQVIAVAKTWHDNRTTQYSGSQAMVYHDAPTAAERATVLDVNTPTLHTPNIECSTLVGMLLRGYAFDETTYSPEWTGPAMRAEDWVANPERYWAINPFEWEASRLADGTNPSRVRIAAAMGRWMEEHGLAVVEPHEMEAGDVVFFARKSSLTDDWVNKNLYRHINHVALCYAVASTESGNIYGLDPDEYPTTHLIIEAGTDEADRAEGADPVEPYPGTNQGEGHGSIYIRPLETRPGPYANGIDTVCLVCRPRFGSLWEEAQHNEIERLKAAIRALGGSV